MFSLIPLINEFPDCGGIGTRIFYAAGGAIMIAAFIALIICIAKSKKDD